MCDYPLSDKIRIMPDVHTGKGCTIGTTMTITDKAVPNIVEVDIGCGMFTVNIGNDEIDLISHFLSRNYDVFSVKVYCSLVDLCPFKRVKFSHNHSWGRQVIDGSRRI